MKKKPIERTSIRLHSIEAETRKAIYHNPNTPPHKIAVLLKGKGIKTTEHSIRTIKSWMRKEGIELPRIPLKVRRYGELKTSKIEKAVSANPSMPSSEIKKMLESNGIHTTLRYISQVRYEMRKKGIFLPRLPSGRRTRKIKTLELSEEQKKLLKKAMPFVNITLHRVGKGYEFSRESLEELQSDVLLRLPEWISRFDSKKSKLSRWIIINVRFAAKNFRYGELKRTLGISWKETRQLRSILFGLYKGMTVEQAAKTIGVTVREAQELLNAYQNAGFQIPLEWLREER